MKRILVSIAMIVAAASVYAQPIVTDSTTRSTSDSISNSTTTIKSPSPTAVAPNITSLKLAK